MDLAPNIYLIILAILVSFLLVFLNGFFVAAEFAFVKVRRTRLEELAGQGVRSARISIRCVDQLDEFLSATQLGITLVSLALGWIGEAAFAGLLSYFFPVLRANGNNSHHYIAVPISFFIITMLHVVLGELVPKSMAIQNPEYITLKLTMPMQLFHKFSRPLIRVFTAIANFILRRLGYSGLEEPPLTEAELKLVMRESHADGVITESEAQIITRAFEFSDKRAIDIMVNAEKVDYLSLANPFEENMAIIKKGMHTRLPLCRSDFNSVIGTIHMKDVWPRLLEQFSNEAFERSARPILYVDTDTRQDRLLKTFQSVHGHLAIVRNPRTKRSVGIVTMEDVIVTLVGEFRDEHGN